MSALDWIAAILTIIGGLNWGLIGRRLQPGVFHLRRGTSAERVVYSLVGPAALHQLIRLLFRESVTESADRR